jgi:serine/threonine-protein kinase RsbW
MPTKWSWQCDRVIPSDTEAGRRIVDAMLQEMATQHWNEHDIFGVHLAVDEALVNAVSHGNARDASKHVRLSCKVSPVKIHVEIVDEGPGFDAKHLPDPTQPNHWECPGGRGVMLMRSFMNRVEFLDRGNHVVLEKERKLE